MSDAMIVSTYRVGDPDPTIGSKPKGTPACQASYDPHDGRTPYRCTWPAGHEGDHIAGGELYGGGRIYATWPDKAVA